MPTSYGKQCCQSNRTDNLDFFRYCSYNIFIDLTTLLLRYSYSSVLENTFFPIQARSLSSINKETDDIFQVNEFEKVKPIQKKHNSGELRNYYCIFTHINDCVII